MTLNERAAKCMGWKCEGTFVFDPRTGRVFHPDESLDDAAHIRDHAIARSGYSAFHANLWDTTGNVENGNSFDGFRRMLLATATQRTEAACRCMEEQR